MKQKNIGSSFDDFLEEEGIYSDTEAVATKRVIAYQIQKMMEEERLTKKEMAERMHTSRSAFDRLLDPKNFSVTLQTLERAATALGKKVSIKLV